MAKKNTVEIALTAQDEASHEIQKAVNKTTKEFSSLNRSLKKIGVDSKEIDKINQEIKDVNPQILENELENVRHQLKKLGMDSKEIDKITKELNKANHEADDLEDSGFDIKNGLDFANISAAGLATALGAAAVNLAKMKVDLHDINKSLEAATGSSQEELESLEESFNNLFRDARGTKEEITQALILTKQTFQDLDDGEIENITNKALILSEAVGIDVNDSIRTADVLMRNFGITSDEAFDLMLVGAQEGLNRSGDLMDTLTEYSPQFKKMGYDADEFLQVLNNGMKEGARNTDIIADAVKEFNIRLTDGSDTTKHALQTLYGKEYPALEKEMRSTGVVGKEAMEDIINRLEDVEDPLLRNQLGVELFGTKWEDMQEDAVLALTVTEQKLEDVEGATERAAQAVDSKLSKSWQRFWNNFKLSLTEMENRSALSFGAIFADSLVKAGNKVEETTDEIKESTEEVKESHIDMTEKVSEDEEFLMALKKRSTGEITGANEEIVESNTNIEGSNTNVVNSNKALSRSYEEVIDVVEEYKEAQIDTINFQQSELDLAYKLRLAQLGEETNAQLKAALELEHYQEELKLLNQEMAILEEKYQLSVKNKGEDAEATRKLKLEIMELTIQQVELQKEIDKANKAMEKQFEIIQGEDGSTTVINNNNNTASHITKDGKKSIITNDGRIINDDPNDNIEVILTDDGDVVQVERDEEAIREIAERQNVPLDVAEDMWESNIRTGEQTYHSGGRVGRKGPRDLAYDEVPIIAKEGELFVDESKMSRIPSFSSEGVYMPVTLQFQFSGSNIFSGSKNEFKRFINNEIVPIVNREIGKTVMKRKKI